MFEFNNPMYNPYQIRQPMQPMQPMQQMAQRFEVIRVNGKGGAEAFQMAPNSEVILLDSTAPIVWLKTTDGAGFPTCTPFSITPYQPEPQVSTSELLARVEALEAKLNGKSNSATAKRNQATDE